MPNICWCCGDNHADENCAFIRVALSASLISAQDLQAIGWKLDAIGLPGVQFADVTGDGNCLYHSLGREIAAVAPTGRQFSRDL